MPNIAINWPNVDVHLYQDRDARWRARLSMSLEGEPSVQYIPEKSAPGLRYRFDVLIEVERRLNWIGWRTLNAMGEGDACDLP
jgi:hypothetical protein